MTCFLLWAKAQWFVHSPLFAQGLSLILWLSLILNAFLPTEKAFSSALLLAVQRCWREYSAAPSFPADSGSLLSWTELNRSLWADLKLGMSLRLPKPDLSSGKWKRIFTEGVCSQGHKHRGMLLQAPEQSPQATDLTAPLITLVHTAPGGDTTLAPCQQWEEAAFLMHNLLLRGGI